MMAGGAFSRTSEPYDGITSAVTLFFVCSTALRAVIPTPPLPSHHHPPLQHPPPLSLPHLPPP
jgi:hypothetical protein